jgi:hypothetical protein
VANNPAELQQLRSWYQSQQTGTASKKMAATTISLPAAEMQWNKAVYYPDDKAWIVPMAIKKNSVGTQAFVFFAASQDAKGNIEKGNYIVLLPNSKKMTTTAIQTFTVLPAMLNFTYVPTAYSGAILQYNMDKAFAQAKHYQSGVLQPGKTDLLITKTSSKGASSDPEPSIVDQCQSGQIVCTDWYWQTWVDGVLVDEEFLFTTCACEGGESGGGGASTCQQICQAAMNNFVAAGHSVNGPAIETTNWQTDTEWNKTYAWKIYDAVTWFLYSYEDAVWEKVYYPSSGQSLWQFKSITHRYIKESGSNVGGSRTFKDNGANFNKSLFSAQVRIDFSVTHKVACNNCPIPDDVKLYNATNIFRIPGAVINID